MAVATAFSIILEKFHYVLQRAFVFEDHPVYPILCILHVVFKLFSETLIVFITESEHYFLWDWEVDLAHIYNIFIDGSYPEFSLIVYFLKGDVIFSFLVGLCGLKNAKNFLLSYHIVYKLLVPLFLISSHTAHSFSQIFDDIEQTGLSSLGISLSHQNTSSLQYIFFDCVPIFEGVDEIFDTWLEPLPCASHIIHPNG